MYWAISASVIHNSKVLFGFDLLSGDYFQASQQGSSWGGAGGMGGGLKTLFGVDMGCL